MGPTWNPTIFLIDELVQKLLQSTLTTGQYLEFSATSVNLITLTNIQALAKYKDCVTKLNMFVKVNCTILKSNVLYTSTKIPKYVIFWMRHFTISPT